MPAAIVNGGVGRGPWAAAAPAAGAAAGWAGGGVRMYAMTWCTFVRAPGLISIACTHLSSVRFVGTSNHL